MSAQQRLTHTSKKNEKMGETNRVCRAEGMQEKLIIFDFN